ncbi:uncharacterized protein LOC120626444 [Pararge aegeria]|uniref:uncharacterized protein LOC120626444 n=1 Tax=Pararge aegeria TaxID=116150 RepID=UPI0019D06329|nr:uncharacterized protein LOC120626444 [Pararge aegeria]
MKSIHVLLFLMPQLSVFAYRTKDISSEIENSKPIFRYLAGNSKQYCKWCNMKPANHEYGKTKPTRNKPQSEEIDLFDIPIFAAMTQDEGNLDKQRLSDFIEKYF